MKPAPLELEVVRVSWGTPAAAKAAWRAESEREFQKLPLKERLLQSLAMLERRKRDEPRK